MMTISDKRQATSENKDAGFTLVELLASIIVLVAVGSVIAGIIASSLRGVNKTNVIENIRQNGNYAINQMSKDIGYSLPFDGINTGLSPDGTTYVAKCPFSPPNPTPTPVSTQYNYISVNSSSDNIVKYKCTSTELSANGESLIDASSASLVSCSLSCIQSRETDAPIIKINFRLGPVNPNELVENSSPPVDFETSVSLRNN